MKVVLQEILWIYCDNVGTWYIIKHLMVHAWTKHKEINFHFIREKILLGYYIEYIPLQENFADVITNNLASTMFEQNSLFFQELEFMGEC